MSSENNITIKVENLSKAYKLYNNPVDRMKESLHPMRKKYHHDFFALKDILFEVKKGETVGGNREECKQEIGASENTHWSAILTSGTEQVSALI